MNSTEKRILISTAERVNYYLKQRFDKYVILEYIEDVISKSRGKYSDELLRCLFDLRQQIALRKEVL